MSMSGNRQAIGPPSSDKNGEEEEEVCQALLESERQGNAGGLDTKASVHTASEKVASEDKEAEMCSHQAHEQA